MSEIHDFTFKVETKEAGQRRSYGDSYYHYIVESKLSVHSINAFCTKVLRPAIPQKQHREEDNTADNHFRSYYTMLKTLNEVGFLEDGYNKVEYMVVSPSTH